MTQNSVAWEWAVLGNGVSLPRWFSLWATGLGYADRDMDVHLGLALALMHRLIQIMCQRRPDRCRSSTAECRQEPPFTALVLPIVPLAPCYDMLLWSPVMHGTVGGRYARTNYCRPRWFVLFDMGGFAISLWSFICGVHFFVFLEFLVSSMSSATSDATSMLVSLMGEYVASSVTTSVTFIFVIDIGLGLSWVGFGSFCDSLETS